MIAGLTRVQFDAFDSYVAIQSPSDGALRIGAWNWDFDSLANPGASTATGAHVSWKYSTSGSKRVKLTVIADDGTSNSTTMDISISASPSYGFDKYVDPGGDDNLNSGNDDTHAYQTIGKALSEWTGMSVGSTWGRINVKKGGTYALGNNFPRWGPLVIQAYGSGAAPVITSLAGADIQFTDGRTDNSYDRPIYVSGIDFYSSANTDGATPNPHYTTMSITHVGTEIENSTITNIQIYVGGTDPEAMSLSNVTQSHGFRYGLYMNAPWFDISDSSFSASGNDNGMDHQIYSSQGTTRARIRNTTVDQNGASAARAGVKSSGSRKFYIDEVMAISCDLAFDTGGNHDDQETQDLVYKDCVMDDCGTGFNPDWCNRVSIRNPRGYGGMAGGVLVPQSWDSTDNVENVELLGGSFASPIGQLFYAPTDSNWGAITIKNTVVYKEIGSSPFFQVINSADLVNLTSDGNWFFRDSGSTGDSGFAFIEVGSHDWSFDDWTGPLDLHSGYGDPKFVDAGNKDLSLDVMHSPCIDAGLTLGVLLDDCEGVSRPQGSGYDVGAFESQ